MKTRQVFVVALALLATAGCRSDPAVPILERELRLKEDEIYRLRAAVDEFRDSATCQERTDRPRSSNAPDEPEAASPRRRSGSAGPSAGPSGARPPQIELPSQSVPDVPDALKTPAGSLPPGVLEVPDNIQRPSKPLRPPEREPGGRLPKPANDHGMSPNTREPDGPALEKGAGGVSARPHNVTMAGQSASAVPFTPSGDSRQVAAIVLDRTLTGGISADDRRGDQGLLVVFEPRDGAGRTVDAPADVSVVVLDPTVEGDAARVARWDFTAAETAAMFRRTGSGRAIHLTTAWPADPPTHNKLRLFVRYVTADGRKLQADQPIEVALAGDKTTRWNPSDRPAEREPPPESRQPSEPLTARVPGHARPDDAKSRRPVWSPERK